ncbi:MAG: acyl-CoA dehydrogenase family protein [Pigmentiphaga sp.]|nr:acyl-CoA dehydrogenase family protein [Pigmentiphaga sp.]
MPDLPAVNGFQADAALTEALARHGSPAQREFLSAYGEWLSRPENRELAVLAERRPPEFEPYDRLGERQDLVRFDAAWHQLMAALRERGLVSLPYREPGEGAWLTWAAGLYLHGQVDAASLCPTIMTTAAIPVLQQEPELFQQLQGPLYGLEYDARDLPLNEKAAMWIGMGMTEKQGGSDLRANATYAEALEQPGRGKAYRITGHKWFLSAPTADAHLVLAITDEGPSCFYVPRWRPDGVRNTIRIIRLKDKLGNRANASSEVEFDGAWGQLVGEPGRGIPTILQMATFSRLACVIGSTAILRQTLVQAIHHARDRWAFGRTLIEQPLMRQLLADMALESEAATWLMVRLARAFERAEQPGERIWCRIMMPAAKFWICKRAVEFSGEALEVWGGNGYVETGPMARWFREAPVNSVWEGSGNVICLDVLRAIRRDPDGFSAWLATLEDGSKAHPVIAQAMARLRADLALPAEVLEAAARRVTQRLVLVAQAVLLLEQAPAIVAEGFIATRFAEGAGWVFGAGPEITAADAILERAWPAG